MRYRAIIFRVCVRAFFLLAAVFLLWIAASSNSFAQPQPGDVFREFTFNYGKSKATHFAELDPNCPRKSQPDFAMAKMAHMAPRPITLDLDKAVRAELSVEYWGGHIGTSNQKFRVNDHEWIDLPQPEGTPSDPRCYHRTLLGNNAAPIPLAHLRQGANVVRFTAGPQIKYSFNWGFYWIYDFTIRVYYDPSRPHPTGRISSPQPDATIGDKPVIAAEASSPNGPVKRVDFIGLCDDFDWGGSGRFGQWQYQTEHGVMTHHIGVATSAPFQVVWQNERVPEQSQPIQIAAKITDASGMSCVTPAVGNLRLRREGRSVRMYRPSDVPEKFAARAGGKASCKIVVNDDLANARAARMVLSTWSASTDDDSVHELRLNGQRLANRFGAFHNYSFDALEVPLTLLRKGENDVTIFSEFDGHALEINWPGPVLLVEFGEK
ncbi:hypothetical protein FJY63_08815 [Candidatus Sumerlaeota bacterium]|nr:hypothetical protein [Candidatus Sumerlaeota bacterium]